MVTILAWLVIVVAGVGVAVGVFVTTAWLFAPVATKGECEYDWKGATIFWAAVMTFFAIVIAITWAITEVST